jgi:tetratricopeptide (TPR) repeat protein
MPNAWRGRDEAKSEKRTQDSGQRGKCLCLSSESLVRSPFNSFWRLGVHFLLLLAIALSGGCISDQQKIQDAVDAGEVALGGNRYDAAIARADEALHIGPTAEAYYIRGRAEEDRPKPDADITNADLEKARADYQAALDLHPPDALAARCRVGLANIAFAHEDYATAIADWSSAVDGLDEPQWRALALYRIGESQQRLGQFDAADKTFQQVRDQYADQDIAVQAQERQGLRGFYVQVGTFPNIDDAEAAVAKAQSAGVTCRQVSDNGLTAVRGGPYGSYAEARRALAAVAAAFPDAAIRP